MLDITPKFPIVLIEGCDASGKSTLINQLMEAHPNNCYIHCAVTNDINSLHQNAIDTALVAAQERWVFIDRLHLSEKIYANVFRNGPSYDVDAFDRMITNRIPTLKKILCVVDKETTLAKHAERKDKEMFDNISKVWDMYNNIEDNWTRYNWKTDTMNINTLEVTYGAKETK
jgi:thymidylate kinase